MKPDDADVPTGHRPEQCQWQVMVMCVFESCLTRNPA
jgi:hypothetical protein